MNEIKEKSVEVSRTEVSHLLCNRDMNGAGRLFGGQLLMWIDEVAGIVAKRHCECNVTTASIDNLQFKEAFLPHFHCIYTAMFFTHFISTS